MDAPLCCSTQSSRHLYKLLTPPTIKCNAAQATSAKMKKKETAKRNEIAREKKIEIGLKTEKERDRDMK